MTGSDSNFELGLYFLILVLALAGKQLLKLIIDKFWKKTIETEYVTMQQCEQYRLDIRAEVNRKVSEESNKTHAAVIALTDKIEKMNELFIIAIIDNPSFTDDQKKEAVIKLTSGHRNKGK